MNNKQKTPRSRVLSFENLENRELLSVSPVVAAAMEATNLDRAALLGEANVDSNYPGPIQFTLPDEADVYTLSNAVVDGGVVLTQPKITSSSSTTKTITVNWNADAAAAGYEIYYNITTDKTNVSSLAVDSAQTSATITNLEPSASYYVRVVALGDGVTTSDSPAKSYKTIKTQALKTLVQPTVTVGATTTHTINFSWNASDGAVNYDVLYRKSTDKAFTTVENVAETNMTLTNLDAGASYVVKVVANGDYNTTQDSAATKTKTIKTVALQKLAQPKITTFASEMHSIDFAWNAVDNASGYEVQYRKSSEKTFTTYEGEITGTSLTINELDPNTSYYVRVIAKGDGDITGDSATKSSKTIKTKPLITLAKPTIASVQTSDSSLTVNWNAIADAANVSVICKRNGTSEKQTFAVDPNSTRLTITGLVSGAKYTVSVVANGDYITTANSPTSAAKTVTLPKFLKAESPAIVNGSTTAHSITFGWEKVDVAARYEISYGEVNGKTPTVISVAATETAYTIAGLEPNKSYYIQTRAIGDNGYANSDYCQPVVFTTLEQAQLAVPTNLRGAVGANSVDLLWDVVNGAASYTIMFGPEGGQDSSLVTLEDASTSYRITGLDPATSYVFQVRANGDGDSIYSSEFSNPYVVTTLDLAPLDAPQATVAARTTSLLTIEWQPVANATGFTVVYGLTGQSGTTTERLPADATSFTLSGLQPTTSVTFKVTAEGDDVEYASSAATEITAATQTKLGAPMATLVGRTTSSIEIGWLAVSNAQGYTVVYGRTGDTETQTAYLEANETGFILDDVAGTTPYTFLVYADGDDDYATSDAGEITVAALGQLAAPTLTATRALDSITIAWDANENADGYTVSYGKTGETPSTTFITDATEFTLPTTGESAYYEFSVVAEGSGDYVSSTPSMISVATMVKLTPPNVTATRTLNTISLEWSADANAQSYMLTYGKTGENGLTIWFDATTTKYAFAGLDSATEYTFQLVAVGDEVDYVSSDATVVAISTQDQLAAPTIVADRGLNSITLSWDADENATAYELVYGEAGSSETTTVTVTDFATPYVVDGLKAATSYAFSLTALSDDDYYASSNASDITVATQTKLNAPVLSVASRTDSSIVFAWKPIANASGYSATLDDSETPIFINSDETSLEFENFDPGTEHTLTIVAEGDGDNFVTSEATTLDAETLGKLATPTLRFSSDVDGITVEWDRVDDATGYLLAYGLTNDDKTTVVTLASLETGYGVTGLESASNYTFTLTALGDGENYVDSEPATDAENTLGKLDKPVAEVLDRALDAITIGWEPVDDADGYMLLCNEEIVYTGTATSYTVEDLDAGCVYTFELVALGDGDYVDSDATEITAATQTQLSTPVIIATSSDSAIALAWSPIANATGYQLVFGDQTQDLGFDQTSYLFTDLDADETYEFKLQAIGDDGDYADSEVATLEVDTLAKLEKPELAVVARTTNSITLGWDENTDASGYTLVYGKSGDTATLSTSISSNETSCTVSGLESGATYTFQLVAEGDDFENVSSDEATTQATTQVQLDAPALSVEARTTNSITVEWGKDVNASGYELYLDDVAVNAALATDDTSYTFTNLTDGASYAFQIKALGKANGDYADSALSEKSYFSTQATLATPELTATALSDTEIALAWKSVANASKYELVYGDKTEVFEADETSFVATLPNAGTSYTFTLTALGDDRDYVDSKAATATAATLVKLAKPELTVDSRATDSVKLAWGAVAGASGYTLSYTLKDSVATTTVPIVKGATSYEVTGLTSGATYTFELVAEGEANTSVASDAATTGEVATLVKLNAPANVKLVEQTTSSFKIVWDGDERAENYLVSVNGIPEEDQITATEFSMTGLPQVSSYTIEIVANAPAASENYVNSEPASINVSTLGKLATPNVTSKVRTENSISFAWDAVSNASGYTLVFGKQGATPQTLKLGAATTQYEFTDLKLGTTYTFELSADADGFIGSDANEFSVVTKDNLATPTVTSIVRSLDQKETPADLTDDKATIEFVWGAVENATSYKFYQDGELIYAGDATTKTITGLTPAKKYVFKLEAYGPQNEAVDKAFYNSSSLDNIEVTTQAKLAAPTLNYEARTTDTITVAWAKNDDADSYQLEYRPKETENWSPVSSDAFALNGTTYTCVVGQYDDEAETYVGGQLQPGTEYDFRLVAKGENDSEPDFIDSEYSATLTQKTQKQLDAPTQLTVARALDTNNVASVTVSWGVVANASSYEVEYRQHVDEGQENAWSQPVSTNETSYTITNLTPATQYDFRIVAKGEVEDPDYVASEAAETTDATRAKLATPTNVTTDHTMNSISLAWSAVDNAVKYAITYGVTDSGTTTTIEVDSPQFSIGGKASGVSYTFVIKAVGDGDYYVDSEPTAAIVAQTQAKLVADAPTLDVRTTTSITVKWNAVDHATGYTLYKDEQAIEVGNVTSYAVTGLAEGTEYSFKIVAKGDEGNDVVNYFTSDPSATVNLKTQRTLATPTLTYASRTTRSIAVDWTATADSAASSYKLEYREKDADQWTAVNVKTGTSDTVANLTPGTTYEFQITAVGDGSAENLNPDFLDSATSAVFTKNTQLELAAPTLTLAAQSTESVTISWNKKDNATGYALYRNGSSSPIATLTSEQSTYMDNVKELAPGSSYSYQIVAKGNASSVEDPNDPDFYDSGKSATLTITKLAAPEITVGDRTTDSITISWSVAENAAGRTLAYRQAGATAWTEIDLAPLDEENEGEPVTSYTFANLAGNATEYEFQVVALGAVASNTVSSEATETASTKKQLAAPTGLSVSSRGLDTTGDVASLEVSWTASANAPTGNTTTYTVYYQTDGETAKTETGISGTSTTLAGLTPGKNYTIQVVAVSTNDEYVSSASSTAITATTQAMLAVPELAFSERTTNSVTLVWNENTNVREYVLTCKTGGDTVDSFTLGSSSKGFKVSLDAGKTYQFELVAKGDVDQTTDPNYLDSGTATLTVATKDTLAAPTLTSAINDNQVTISWDAVANASSYWVYLDGNKVAEKSEAETSYVKNDLTAGTTYTFTVVAKGNDETATDTSVVSYLDSVTSDELVVEKLAAFALSVDSRTDTAIAVSWEKVDNATAYAIYLGDNKVATLDADPDAEDFSYEFSGLTHATEYSLKVVAEGNSENIVATVATESVATLTKLAAPTLKFLSSTLDTTGEVATITVSWTESTNADSYTLTYVNQNDASDNGSFTTDDASTTSYTIPNLKSGSTYLVRIVANGSGEFVSSALNEITAKTQAKLDRPVVTIGERTESSLAVSWTASANASSYTLVYNGVEVNNIEDTSYVLEGLTGNTTYEIQIVANPASDDYVASSSVAINAKTKTKLATPTLQYASRGTNSIEVSISNVDGATSYVLSYVNTEDATDAGTATTATLTGLKEGATYSITVVAKGPANDYVDSDESSALTVTTQTQLVMSEVEAKSALNAEGTRASLTFSWDSVANADGGYLIEYRVAGTEGDWTPANPVAAGITTETVNGLDPKTTYEFRAMALASNGADDPSASYYLDSAWSESKTITTLEKLAAIDITGISTGNATSGTVDLSWTSVANAIGYVVSYAETGSTAATETSLISGGDGTTMSYTLTGLKAERTYDIRIKAVGDHENYNDSDYSAAVSATTTRGATVAPTELTAAATATTVTLTWTAAENAAGYEIQDAGGAKLGETTETTFTLTTGVTPSTPYTFKVKTLGETGYDDSTEVATVNVTTLAQTQLTAPTGLTLSIPKDSGSEPVVDAISATWESVEGAQSYSLRYYLAGDAANAETVEVATNSAVIEGLQEGETYVVQVRANGAENDDTTLPSDFSSPAEVATATTLATPIFTQVEKDITSNSGGASLKVTWNASEGATSYLLVCKQNGVVKTSVNVTDGLTGTLNGLDGGREYTIELYAKGENYRTSTPAVINNVRTQEMLATPSNISGTRNGNNNNRTFTFTWTGDARAIGYRVWYRTSSTGAYTEATNLATSTTWTSGTLRNATNCYVRVQAVYSGPNTDLVDSIEAEGRTQYQF